MYAWRDTPAPRLGARSATRSASRGSSSRLRFTRKMTPPPPTAPRAGLCTREVEGLCRGGRGQRRRHPHAKGAACRTGRAPGRHGAAAHLSGRARLRNHGAEARLFARPGACWGRYGAHRDAPRPLGRNPQSSPAHVAAQSPPVRPGPHGTPGRCPPPPGSPPSRCVCAPILTLAGCASSRARPRPRGSKGVSAPGSGSATGAHPGAAAARSPPSLPHVSPLSPPPPPAPSWRSAPERLGACRRVAPRRRRAERRSSSKRGARRREPGVACPAECARRGAHLPVPPASTRRSPPALRLF